ncbi:hypothetical protein FH603_5784 [Spirosoma sp. LMG 31447]|uniref:Uncharacterized protein n=1 Tax=Spirosoma utsteinense TaxID=2585773 RepID=A0ABR6WFF6_9BACT|nr:hypothetical protein [Spirosoma utsteinense]
MNYKSRCLACKSAPLEEEGLKDIILVAAGMVIAPTWTGAHLVVQSTSVSASLRRPLPRVQTTGKLHFFYP